MTSQQTDPPNDDDVDEFPRALIHAEETVREVLAEKLDATGRVSMRSWVRPSLGAALLLAGAAALAYKVITDYRHASPEAFVSVQDQNKHPAASTANRSTAPATVSAVITAIPPSGPVAAPAAPSIVAPKNDRESASSGATDANSAVPDDPACAAIKTEQHEINAALDKQHSTEEGHYMQRRLRELTEQSGKWKCDG
ncbi:MAG TPA: hypothetical protein VGI65_04485 [Steroidobacteraceae bacterium]|jgi:hypothetical protein